MRNETKNIVQHATLLPAKNKSQSWRKALRDLTDDGRELLTILLDISRGMPQQRTLPDGRVSEPMVPTAEVQFQAAKSLFEFLNGKAVAQTEVIKAEEQTILQEQLAAMSNEDLLEAARPLLEAAQKRMELTDGGAGIREEDGQTD